MEIILKILSLLVVVTGAVLVYGAKAVVKRVLEKQAVVKPGFDSYTNDGVEDEIVKVGKGIEVVNDVIEEANDGMKEIIAQKIVSIKKTGLLILMAGAVLAVVAFR